MASPFLVLVVDDDAGARSSTQLMLESMGHAVRTATCQSETWQYLANAAAVLLDCDLGAESGLDLARKIRASEASRTRGRRRMTIVGMSGRPQRQAGLAAGMDDFLLKPFSVDELAATFAHCGL